MTKELDMQNEVVETIRLAGTICTQRSQPELVRLLKKHLPIFFGFQGVGVMLKDQKSSLMFTLNEIRDHETGTMHRQTKREGSKSQSRSDDETSSCGEMNARELRKMEKITIPSNLGLSGRSQTTG